MRRIAALLVGLVALGGAVDSVAQKGRCPDGSQPPCGGGGGGGQVQIAELDDIELGAWPGGGPLVARESLCVQGGQPNGRFRMEATGSGPGGAFALQSGTEHLSYEVAYDDGGGYVALTAGRPHSGLQGVKRNKDFDACLQSGRDRDRIRIRIPANALEQAIAASYSGTLRLQVEPE